MTRTRKPPTIHVVAGDRITVLDSAEVRGLVPLARLYYDIGLRAARNGVAFGTGPVEWNRAPYIAVFFAFATAEAYLPELHRSPTADQAAGLDNAKLKSAVKARKANRPLEDAYAAGERDAGKRDWYKRLRCLRILRNELVHFQAQAHSPDQWPPRLTKTGARDAIQGWVTGAHDWTSQLLVPAVAVWACDTVRLAIKGLHARVGGSDPWSWLGERWP